MHYVLVFRHVQPQKVEFGFLIESENYLLGEKNAKLYKIKYIIGSKYNRALYSEPCGCSFTSMQWMQVYVVP